MKKAQSLSINTIIIAILAMLVLVILIFVIGKNIRDLNTTTQGCFAKGGECKKSGEICDPLTEIEIKNTKECGNNKCCMPMFNKENE